MNFALFDQLPKKAYEYDITCYNDIGHFVYSSSCGKTFMNLPGHIGDFMRIPFIKHIILVVSNIQ